MTIGVSQPKTYLGMFILYIAAKYTVVFPKGGIFCQYWNNVKIETLLLIDNNENVNIV